MATEVPWSGALFNDSMPTMEERRVSVEEIKATADMVNLPGHYARFPIEPIRFIAENGLDFLRGNAIKYILRCDAKGGEEDIAKAIRYLEMFKKKHFDGDPDWWQARRVQT